MPEIPESVTVPGAALIEATARLLAIGTRLRRFTGDESYLAEWVDDSGWTLFAAAFGPPEWGPDAEPLGLAEVVEARSDQLELLDDPK